MYKMREVHPWILNIGCHKVSENVKLQVLISGTVLHIGLLDTWMLKKIVFKVLFMNFQA